MPNTRLICGHTKGQDENIILHRFPKDKSKLQEWLRAFNLKESEMSVSSRVCGRHFPNGDSSLVPSLHLGKCFVSPKKRTSAQARRAIKRQRLFLPVSTRLKNLLVIQLMRSVLGL